MSHSQISSSCGRGAFGGSAAFVRETGWLADACRAAAPAGPDPVRLPGDRGLERKPRALADGVELYPGILDALAPHAARLGVTPPRPLV